MAVKKTTNDLVTAYRIINPAKLTKMNASERHDLIAITRKLKKVNDDFDSFIGDAQERLKPEELFDNIVGKLQKKEELTPEESAVWDKYNKEVNDCANIELKKDVELDIEPLADDVLDHFFDSNDFRMEEILFITDIIGV